MQTTCPRLLPESGTRKGVSPQPRLRYKLRLSQAFGPLDMCGLIVDMCVFLFMCMHADVCISTFVSFAVAASLVKWRWMYYMKLCANGSRRLPTQNYCSSLENGSSNNCVLNVVLSVLALAWLGTCSAWTSYDVLSSISQSTIQTARNSHTSWVSV